MAIWSRFFGSAVSTGVGYGMGSALGPALQPVTQEVANEAWALYPHRPLPATIAAAMVAQGKLTMAEGKAPAKAQGFDHTPFERMVQAQQDSPELVLLMELWRRNFIDEPAVTSALERHGLEARWLEPLRQLKTVRPSVQDMVRFGVREVYTPEIAEQFGQFEDLPPDFVKDAAHVGVSAEDAKRYWGAHWDLPSATQGAEMMHRKIIDPPTYRKLLRALDVMPFWREKLLQLAAHIPPIGDLIRFSVREVYQDATASKYGYDADYPDDFTRDAALHGMNAERAKQYWRAHWRLPSAQQGYRMLHRDEIDEGELDDLLRIQDYPRFWRNRLRNIAYLVPGRVDLRRLYIADVIDRGAVKRGYQRLGYREADAERLTQLAEALKGGGTTAKGLTATDLADEYEARWITRTQYVSGLKQVGYSDASANAKATAEESKRTRKARDQRITLIGARYIAHQIGRDRAVTELDAAQVPARVRDSLIPEWDAQRALTPDAMTPAQIKKAWYQVRMTRPEAVARLEFKGYDAADAEIYLDE